MDHSRNFDWGQLSWENFQTLIIHFAQNLFTDTKFEEFLKKGNAQLGIDLKSFVRNDGKLITIQCKREKKLNLGDLKKIINDFETQSFVNITSEFIIATTADLQKPDLQAYLDKTAVRFRRILNIGLKYWDINYLDEQLKHYYALVYCYFGKQATAGCFPAFSLPERFNNRPAKNHIRRRVFEFNINDDSTHIGAFLFQQKTYSLFDIFQENRLRSKQICLIGDAYQGKSHLIQQTAFDLEHCEVPFKPIIIQIKDFPLQPIDNLLNQLFGEWGMVPAKDLVLFFDGIDEVPTDQFDEAIRHINLFSISYPFISIVISCRKLFYHRNRVQSVLKTFNTFELYPLQYFDVYNYLKEKLGNRYEKFQHEVSQIGISHFLYHPFFLINLVAFFQTPPFKLPGTKVQALEKFIEEAFNKQSGRRTNKGQLQHRIVKYKAAVQKLAFALQLSGLNSFTDDEIQTLFSDAEIELLQHNSLVTVSNNRWSFSNALFQEHLAAMVLSNLSFTEILSFVSVGKRNKKIKTKWIQTISSLFNILEPGDKRTTALINFIQKDNIELIFTAEKTKFSPQFRLNCLKALLAKCWKLQIRPMAIYENDIAGFINHDIDAIHWLIKQIVNRKYSVLNKTTIFRIVRSLSSLEGNEDLLFKIVSSELKNVTDPYLAGLIFTALSAHNLGNADFNLKMTKHPLAQYHDFRNGLYELIIVLDMVDQFYSFALDGYKALISHNEKITHAGSEHSLEQLLLASKNPNNFRSLLVTMGKDEWINYHERHSIRGKDFIQAVLSKAKTIYSTDNTIVFEIVSYINVLGRKYLRDDMFNEIDSFFEETNSHNLAVRIMINDIVSDRDWELGALIREGVFDYLLFEFDQLPLNFNNLKSCVSALRYKNRNETADKLAALIIDYTEAKIIESDSNAHSEYMKLEEQKRANDLIYISSQENFRNGVVKFFDAYGKSAIPEDDLFVDFEKHGEIRKASDSYFIYFFLLRWVSQDDKKVYLKDALKIIDNADAFEFYRAKEIFKYNYLSGEAEKQLTQILNDYYDKEIQKLEFENCIIETETNITYQRKQKLLGQIFERFTFKTPGHLLIKLVWVDTSGAKGFEHNTINNRKSISQKILEQLDDKDTELFRQSVISNIKKGIKSSSVLGTHLDVCRHLKITESTPEILQIILSNKYPHLPDYEAIDIYLELGGDLSQLLPYFKQIKDCNSYTFLFLGKKIKEKHKSEVIAEMMNCLKSGNIQEERKMELATELANLGERSGFQLLIDYLKTYKTFPNPFHAKLEIKALPTSYVLSQIKDLMHLIIDPAFKDLHFDESPRNTIVDWLFTLSSKSEEDMELVVDFIYVSMKKLQKNYSNTSELFWYANQVIERFRDSDKTVKTISQVQKIVSTIEI